MWGEEGMGPEFEAGVVEQVKSIAREFVVESLTNPDIDRGTLVEKLQRSIEQLCPSSSLVRDARQSYALAIAFCDLARQDEQYEEFFWDAYEALEYDQALIDALSQDERRIYEEKIERIKSGDAL